MTPAGCFGVQCSVCVERMLPQHDAGTKTCFTVVTGLTLGEAMRRDKSALPEDFAAGRFCEDYEFRCEASARTWARPHAQDNLLCAALAHAVADDRNVPQVS